jgi:hypothetical protein
MRYGITYVIFKPLLDNIRFLTIVEWFKFLFESFGKTEDQKKHLCRIAVDVFIILKWLLIIILWNTGYTNGFITFLTWYLLITNVYSYFYHHIWSDEALISDKKDANRVRRRFLNLIFAMAFSNLCFAYLYIIRYSHELKWSGEITKLKAGWFSISNSLAANYSDVSPDSDLGNSVAIAQLIITFFFVTIVFSRSIPEIEEN